MATCYIRPQRYTREFVDREEYFTLAFFDEEHRKAWPCAAVRAGVRWIRFGSAALPSKRRSAARLILSRPSWYVCRKRYAQPMDPDRMPEDVKEKWYPGQDYHILYLGEIVGGVPEVTGGCGREGTLPSAKKSDPLGGCMTQNDLQVKKNRAVLVGLWAHRLSVEENATEETVDELADLLETAGGECVGTVLQSKDSPDPRTFIGEGKVAEVRELVRAMDADMVIFDNSLSPSQQRVLSEELKVAVMDRSALILDIFAQRARTREGRLQVELAQYKYLLPRLLGMWTHLERQEGAIGTRAPARPSWRPTGGTSAARSRSCGRSWSRCGGCGPPSAPAGRRTRCRWWPSWAIPTRASPPCSTG